MSEELEKIRRKLRRYTFESKMGICYFYGIKLMQENYIISKSKNMILPWELELFCILSIMSGTEINDKTFTSHNDPQMLRILTTIRNYCHPHYTESFDLDDFLMVTAQQQFHSQHDIRLDLFRYHYLFHYKNDSLDLSKIFKDNFGYDYSEIMEAAWVICISSKVQKVPNSFLQYVYSKYDHIYSLFTKTREEHILIQNKLSDNINNYYYGLKSIEIYPFIQEKDEVFFPLPHLLIPATTKSLLSKLTRNNNELRNLIGKNAFEDYLKYLLESSEYYEEVIPEKKYTISKHQTSLSPDVMTYYNDTCIFFDSKMYEPSLSLREFCKEKKETDTKTFAKYIVKMYNQIKNFINGKFYPFSQKKDFNKENIFGVIVQQENHYISREKIYMTVSAQLSIDYHSDEMKYIRSHIKIIDFTEIEEVSLSGHGYDKYLLNQCNVPEEWNSVSFINNKISGHFTKEYQKFNDYLKHVIDSFTDIALEEYQYN